MGTCLRGGLLAKGVRRARMERMRSIPVDLILHELAARLAELPDTQHRDLHRAISRGCIRPQSIAEEWTSGAGVAQQAAWLVRRLDGDISKPASLSVTTGPGMSVVPTGQMVAAETRAMEVAVARRLADCALALLVTQDTEDASTAQTLLQAAQRVVGLATAKPVAESVRFTSATDSAEDDLSPATLHHHLAATRDALGLGSGPVFLSDIVARAKALADADAARHAAEVENANKASVIAKQEGLIANLTRERDAWSAWATKLAGQGHEHSSSKALREALSARLIDSKGQRLKVARDCLPPNVDIIACMRGNEPTSYKASNADDEHATPESAVRAAWEHHQRPAQPAPACAFKVGDVVRFARIHPESGADGRPPLGWSGTITRIAANKPFSFKVEGQRYDGDMDAPWWLFAGESLDLVTPTA